MIVTQVGDKMRSINYIPIKQKDGYITKLIYLSSQKKPKASILILHGMAEHCIRYYPFAEYLLDLGLDVYLYNHRGHGRDKRLDELGYISDHKGYQLLIEDAITISKYINKNSRTKNLFLFGHSMGSLIARNVIQTYNDYNGVILCGTAYPSQFLIMSGLFITCLIKKIKGPRYISPFLHNLIFGNKKYTVLSDRTAYDWLSRSHPAVGAYVHDPYCGFTCTASFYHDLMKLTANAANKKLLSKTKADLPLFIISGEKDPVGGYGKDVKELITVYKSLGFTNIDYKLYPDCRHELLNELNKHEVYEDIYNWISKKI
ncbi:hypothetical protein SD1D_2150 [Herbinix luporum]|jgi:alpha-beta hydrolase superfamily lysophospholipase|uniref:Serine aminopeptidase S33 domain-containing protein n=2 Tax=Herbinix luporum TaxID=1679721 RepID=A0A0K8J8U6_9FIRM|nr:hypothetical protein SD1D_2150 [Herbinix luporum]